MKRIHRVQRVFLLFGFAILSLIFASSVLAHAEIESCTPAIDGTVAEAPATLVCTASQGMEPEHSKLEVFDASGAQVDMGDSTVDLNDPDRTKISVTLDPSKMIDGVYTVKWVTVSLDDGDEASGEFKFTVGSAAPPAQVTATGSATPAAETTPPAAETHTHDDEAAAEYCTEKGGTVTSRHPAYNTNGSPDQWLRLAGSRDFCTFHSAADADGFQSQISIALDTLYADEPTLAVLAYLEPIALPPATGANPSSIYCARLGGTDSFGGADNLAGGGWVTEAPDSATNLQVVSMCAFPDMSAIDSWGLTYNAAGVKRGTDLLPLVRYQPQALPPAFVSGTGSNQPSGAAVDKTLTASDNGSSVTLKPGDILRVELASNPSTGYSWRATSSEDAVLAPLGQPHFELGSPGTPIPGGGGTEILNFHAVAPGEATLTLVYARPWENATPTPNDTWTVQVTVE